MKLKIGYTVKIDSTEERRLLLIEEGCQEVVRAQDEDDNYQQFATFLTTYKHAQLVVVSLQSIGLQFSQLAPLLERIRKERLDVHFVEKQGTSNSGYIEQLLQLARAENEIIGLRAQKTLRLARARAGISTPLKTK